MSYTKQTIIQLKDNTSKILEETINDNDLTDILNALNIVMDIGEIFSEKHQNIGFYWNEIISEMISVVHATISGFPRLGLSGLRNILELSCHAFYYLDHKIELKLLINIDKKSDKYVSSLIRDDLFFTSNYIKLFNNDNKVIEAGNNKVSDFIHREYRELCDIVHGRNRTLFKKNGLKVEYNKSQFKYFERHYLNISTIIALMYVLRFNDYSNEKHNKLASRTNLISVL